jgi:hypothetical protein
MTIYWWTLKARDETDVSAEFDGYTFTAPTIDAANQIVAGLSGEYGAPKDGQYDEPRKKDVAYIYDGDEAEWRDAVRRGDES